MCSWRLKLDATPSNLNLVGVIFNFFIVNVIPSCENEYEMLTFFFFFNKCFVISSVIPLPKMNIAEDKGYLDLTWEDRGPAVGKCGLNYSVCITECNKVRVSSHIVTFCLSVL